LPELWEKESDVIEDDSNLWLTGQNIPIEVADSNVTHGVRKQERLYNVRIYFVARHPRTHSSQPLILNSAKSLAQVGKALPLCFRWLKEARRPRKRSKSRKLI